MDSGNFCITVYEGRDSSAMARGDNNRDDRTKTLAIPILLDI
jgi:hypothetical protein